MTEKDLIKQALRPAMPDLETVRRRCTTQPPKPAASFRVLVRRLAPAAVCALLAIAALFAVPRLSGIPAKDDRTGVVTDGGAAMTAPATASAAGSGVTIPRIELPETGSAETDMIGLVVYNGNIYTQAELLRCSEAEREALLGEYLGYATGGLDEFSDESEYSQEFASNIAGEIYTVNGYDSAFRICMSWETEDGPALYFLENLNGITLTTGEDLYGSRLGLRGNYTGVLYETHGDWDNSSKNYKTADIPAETLATFVDALYASPFVDLEGSGENIYDAGLEQTHLYFQMDDGTTVELRLFENGYVKYAHMYGYVFVSMDDPSFAAVFEACLS